MLQTVICNCTCAGDWFCHARFAFALKRIFLWHGIDLTSNCCYIWEKPVQGYAGWFGYKKISYALIYLTGSSFCFIAFLTYKSMKELYNFSLHLKVSLVTGIYLVKRWVSKAVLTGILPSKKSQRSRGSRCLGLLWKERKHCFITEEIWYMDFPNLFINNWHTVSNINKTFLKENSCFMQ